MTVAWDDMAGLSVLGVDRVVALEQRIAAEGTSLYELMKCAGAAVAEVVHAEAGAAEVVRPAVDAEVASDSCLGTLLGCGAGGQRQQWRGRLGGRLASSWLWRGRRVGDEGAC